MLAAVTPPSTCSLMSLPEALIRARASLSFYIREKEGEMGREEEEKRRDRRKGGRDEEREEEMGREDEKGEEKRRMKRR
jgi:hypothetical protein